MDAAAPLNRYHLAEPARAAMLLALVDGTARPAGELAHVAGITPSNASAHLRRLLDGGLLAAYAQGRHRYYRLADERVAAILESLSLAPATAPWPLPTRADAQLRWARCCYRHLAGALGVAFCATLLQRDWLQTGSRGLFLQPDGAAAPAASGLELTDVPPLYGRSCLDWTEHRMHLGGPLGAMLTTAMLRVGWLRPLPHGRTLQPSVGGLRQLGILGVPLD